MLIGVTNDAIGINTVTTSYKSVIQVNNKCIALLIVAVMAFASLAAVAGTEGSDAAFTVTDGEGTMMNFDAPAKKIITIGVGVTATAIGVGALDKIVVCDNYSKTNADPLFDKLREYVEEKKIAANGNIYSSGLSQLKTDIIASTEADKGGFDKENDVIIASVSASYRAPLNDFLTEYGFKKVLYWSTVEDYEDIIDFVEAISLVCNGKVDSNAGTMRAVSDKITSTLEKEKPEKVKAFYVTYSGNAFKVGNVGSITTAMIEAAGGEVITKDSSKPSTYETNLNILVSENPGVVIFADNQIVSDTERYNQLKTLVGETKIYGLQSIWNNYSIESAKGVWSMASAMYPELFDGDIPTPGETQDNTMLYLCASVIAIVILVAVAYLFMRSSKGASKRKIE